MTLVVVPTPSGDIALESSECYVDVEDLRAAGVEGNDEEVQEVGCVASRIVDSYCGTTFDAARPQTVKVSDVRRALVHLPAPFRDVTDVKVNGYSLAAVNFIVETWGIRLYAIVPAEFGWPLRGTGVDGGTWPYQSSSAPYGSQVEVAATFGYPTKPGLVKQATKVVAIDVVGVSSDAEPGQVAFTVGGYDVRWNPNDPHPLRSTGSIAADRLLQSFRRDQVLVG